MVLLTPLRGLETDRPPVEVPDPVWNAVLAVARLHQGPEVEERYRPRAAGQLAAAIRKGLSTVRPTSAKTVRNASFHITPPVDPVAVLKTNADLMGRVLALFDEGAGVQVSRRVRPA